MGVREWVAVANPREVSLITVAHAVNEFYSVALPPILPLLVADLSITYAEAGGLLAVFYAMYSVFQLPAGVLSDRIGKKRLLALGMVGLAAGMLVAGVARSYPTLVLAQAIAGIGGSTYHPTGMSLIADLESGDTEGTAMGVHGVGGVAGTALAPVLIGGLATLADWRLALAGSAAVGLVYAVVFAALFAEERPTAADGAGGAEEGAATDWRTPRAAVAATLRVPLTPWLGALFAANLFASVQINAMRTFTTSYVVARAGDSTAYANGLFFLMLVGAGVASLWAGRLADRFDRRWLGIGTFLATAGLLLVTNAVPVGPALFAWFLVLGAAMYACLPAINALTAGFSDREYSGGLFGITLTAGSLGGAIGPVAVGAVADRVGVVAAYPSVAAVSLLGALSLAALFRW